MDNWYSSNLSSYSSYLSTTAIYCADRSNERVSSTWTYYPVSDRITSSASRPTYSCASTNASRYTTSTSTGNGYLGYPIALLTADEVVYAGLIHTYTGGPGASLNSYIMDNATAYYWWTMSPATFNSSGPNAQMFFVNPQGVLYTSATNSNQYSRPAISFKSNVEVVGGVGSKENPYIVANP